MEAGPRSREGPLIVVLNHPSWWDPLVGLVVSELWPERKHFAPIDQKALERYRFFERLGFFGVESGSMRGGRAFLESAISIASEPGTMLWITAQGSFTDPRERPVRLLSGIGHLAARLDRGCVLPIALEYPFWNERTPEALARLGPYLPLGPSTGATTPDEWTALIASHLEATQDALAHEARERSPAAFEVLLNGAVGVGGVYDIWRRLQAAIRGERFRPEHDRDVLTDSRASFPRNAR